MPESLRHMPIWIHVIEWVARGILVLLFGLSVWSIAIILDRYKLFSRIEKSDPFEEARKLIDARDFKRLREWGEAKDGLRAGTLKTALTAERSTESIDRAVRSYLTSERSRLESGLTALATLGSNAPFIGLFGTVLGIIQAFGALSGGSSASGDVMKGISEALVATAVGLFVAIPAVIAYNFFTRKLRVLLSECESLRDLYVSRNPQNGS